MDRRINNAKQERADKRDSIVKPNHGPARPLVLSIADLALGGDFGVRGVEWVSLTSLVMRWSSHDSARSCKKKSYFSGDSRRESVRLQATLYPKHLTLTLKTQTP